MFLFNIPMDITLVRKCKIQGQRVVYSFVYYSILVMYMCSYSIYISH
jgi:hypothetical protein